MIKTSTTKNGRFARFVSEYKDWTDSNGNTVCVWEAIKTDPSEYNEIIQFFKTEFDIDVDILGSITAQNGNNNLVVTITSGNIPHFAVKRFMIDGLRWFYDFFAEGNFCQNINTKEFEEIYERIYPKNT